MLEHRRFTKAQYKISARRRLCVYTRRDRLGNGPCLSYYVDHRERLRFDLFDPAHMHDALEPGAPRHYYPEVSMPERVELAIADLICRANVPAKAIEWARMTLIRKWQETGGRDAAPR